MTIGCKSYQVSTVSLRPAALRRSGPENRVHPLTFLLIAILFSAVPAPSAGGQGGNPAPPPAARPDPLAEARELYNAKQFDRAAEKAEEARKLPDLANAAPEKGGIGEVIDAHRHIQPFLDQVEV